MLVSQWPRLRALHVCNVVGSLAAHIGIRRQLCDGLEAGDTTPFMRHDDLEAFKMACGPHETISHCNTPCCACLQANPNSTALFVPHENLTAGTAVDKEG